MKNLLKFSGLFIILSIVFSSLTACSNSANSQKGPVDEKTAADNNATTGANTVSKSKSSEYPPAPVAIMQAEIKNLDGNIFKVEDLKGKVVLLNLWATWCGPCRQEMPELVAMESEFTGKGYKTIGLNVDDETPEQIKPFAEQMKLNYELAWADEKLMREFIKISKETGIPQSFLIDREGHLRGVFFGASRNVITKIRENVEKVVNE